MKSTIATGCLILSLFALLTVASAQEQLNFAQLPLINAPSPMPDGYGQLDWSNFYYVNPYGWSGAGPGYRHGPQGEDIAFVGAKDCDLYDNVCYGTLSDSLGFQLVNASVAAGYAPTQVTVTAYKNGVLLGSTQYFVTTSMRTLTFPTSWGIATEVVFQVAGQPGNLVVYNVGVYTLGG